MQRLFSTFPSGLPGAGLLILRLTVGSMAAVEAGNSVHVENVGELILLVIAMAGAVMIVPGFLTPASGLLIAGASAARFVLEKPEISGVFLVLLAVAVILLGPGAISVDARLFGRREVIIPDD